MEDNSSFPAQDFPKRVANLKQKHTNNKDFGSYSTAANAGKISLGVGYFIAGCFGLKAVFVCVCVLVKNFSLSIRD